MTNRNIAILPARGGSKRIPGKNIRPFNGRPMIAWPLEAARQSGLFDIIHVSTDSPDVAKVASQLGHAPDFSRPPELAGDMIPMRPVIRHVIAHYAAQGVEFDRAFVLFPCAPFLRADDLRQALQAYDASAGRYDLLSVAPYPVPVEWAYRMGSDHCLRPLQPDALSLRSQDIEPSYYETGTLAIFNARRMRENELGDSGNFIGFPIPRERAIDIDTEDDWKMAEHIHAALQASGKL